MLAASAYVTSAIDTRMKISELIPDVGRPVAFYPRLREVAGSVNAALLLCQLLYWHGKQDDPDGWIMKRGTIDYGDPDGEQDASSQSLERETGLTYREQVTARRLLKERGLLRERRDRLNHRSYFQLDLDALQARWNDVRHFQERAAPFGPARDAVRIEPERASIKGNYIDYAETTTEIRVSGLAKRKEDDMSEPDREPTFGEEEDLLKYPQVQVLREVCGEIPAVEDLGSAIAAVMYIENSMGDGVVEYLRPFWNAWQSGQWYRRKGRPYPDNGLSWLIEWAAFGKIPHSAYCVPHPDAKTG